MEKGEGGERHPKQRKVPIEMHVQRLGEIRKQKKERQKEKYRERNRVVKTWSERGREGVRGATLVSVPRSRLVRRTAGQGPALCKVVRGGA